MKRKTQAQGKNSTIRKSKSKCTVWTTWSGEAFKPIRVAINSSTDSNISHLAKESLKEFQNFLIGKLIEANDYNDIKGIMILMHYVGMNPEAYLESNLIKLEECDNTEQGYDSLRKVIDNLNKMLLYVYVKKTEMFVKRNQDIIEAINRLPSELQLRIVQRNHRLIQFLTNPPEEIRKQVEAVRQNKEAIAHIENPEIEVQIEAVMKKRNNINHIENPSFFPKLEAERKTTDQFDETNINNSQDSLIEEKIVADEEMIIDTAMMGNYLILDNTKSVDKQLLFLANAINIKSVYIAVGFLYRSGLELIDEIISRVNQNFGKSELIIGSLQNYYLNRSQGDNHSILGMDKNTAQYLNNLIEKNKIHIKTFEESFYHGKFYLLEGEKTSCIIIGSSNVSNAAFNLNRELNVLFKVNNDDLEYHNFRNWFISFWDKCTSIESLDAKCFNNSEIQYISNFSLTKLQHNEVLNRINELTDEELKFRLNLWLRKNPDNVYTDLEIESLSDYVIFEFEKHKLLVFESFESGNAYYCFRNKSIEEILVEIKGRTKSQIFELSDMNKRGYHIHDNIKLESKVNSMFVKKYK